MSEHMYKLKVGVYKILQALEQQEDTTAQSTVLDWSITISYTVGHISDKLPYITALKKK